MASPFKDQKLMFLVAAVITVVTAGVLIANVQDANGQGVKVSNDTLDQITSIIVQIMVVFWVALIGYFVYKYFTTRKSSRAKGERRSESDGTCFLTPSSAFLITLVIWQRWRRNRVQARSDGNRFERRCSG